MKHPRGRRKGDEFSVVELLVILLALLLGEVVWIVFFTWFALALR